MSSEETSIFSSVLAKESMLPIGADDELILLVLDMTDVLV